MTNNSALINNFSISRLPRILFGAGEFSALASEISSYGRQALIVTGGRSFTELQQWINLQEELQTLEISWSLVRIPGEPSPEWVDDAVAQYKNCLLYTSPSPRD